MIGCLVLPYFYTEAEAQRLSLPGANPRASFGRAVIIHARGRIAALSPEAEQAGLSQGMPLGQAYAICPHAEALPYDEDLYRAAQRRVLDICAAHLSVIEPFSLHELFFDLANADDSAKLIIEIVTAQAGFTLQAGAGSSKLVARIVALQSDPQAVGRAFPSLRSGQALRPPHDHGHGGNRNPRPTDPREKLHPLIVPKGHEAQFLAPLPLSRLWLLDPDTIEHLQALGITTIGLLQQTPPSHLLRFGRMGRRLRELAVGIDRSPVRACYPPPLIEARLALGEGAQSMTVIETGLRRLARQMANQMRQREQGCRRVGLEIETDDGRSLSQSLRLSVTVASEQELFRAAERLLGRLLEPGLTRANPMAPITALMFRAADLQHCAGVQLDLLGDRVGATLGVARDRQADERRERLTEVVASAQKRFGARSVRWAREVETPRRERMLACLAEGGFSNLNGRAGVSPAHDLSPARRLPIADSLPSVHGDVIGSHQAMPSLPTRRRR